MLNVNVDELLNQFSHDCYLSVVEAIIERTKVVNAPHKGLDQNSALVQSVQAIYDGDKIIITMNKYGEYLDQGRKAGGKLIPFNALYRWVLHNKIAYKDKRGRNRNQKGRFTKASPREVTYKIRMSIFRKGIKPRKFLAKATKDIEQLISLQTLPVQNIIQNALDKLENKDYKFFDI